MTGPHKIRLMMKAEWAAAQRLTIPQYGRSESLNVSVAASIVLYEYVRQIEAQPTIHPNTNPKWT